MKYGKKNEIKIDPLAYNLMLIGESGIGKEQPVSEPVLTEFGWLKMGDIKVGTRVFGEDGELHTVTAIYPQGIKDVYEVTFRDGTKTRCGLDHLWTVSTKKQRESMRKNNDYRFKVLTLKEIIKDYKTENKNYKRNGHKYKYKYNVPINKPINFNIYKDSELYIDPYVLGLLLGDGGFTEDVITFTNSENDLFDELSEWCNNNNLELKFRHFENHKQANICIKDKNKESNNSLMKYIKELGLHGCDSRNKFIPNKYLYSSIKSRIDLLSGIINTDGSVINKTIVVSTYSEILANNIAELARSLGFVCRISNYDRTNNKSTKKYSKEIEYHISIIGNDYSVLRLSNKHKNRLLKKNAKYVKSIINIKLIGKEESQCIMVDNPNHLYITNDYIVTHNTTVIKEYCEKLAGDSYIFLETGKEDGANAISGINYLNCPDWESDYDEDLNSIGFNTFIEDVIENRSTDWKDLRVVVIDTIDELFSIAEPEVIEMHNREYPKKRIKSIKGAFGGFQAGEDKVIEIILDRLWALKKVGVSFIVIGHTKNRNVTDPVTGEDYLQLTTNMPQKYFNSIKTKVHFLGVAAIDRKIIKENTGKKDFVTKEIIKKGVVKEEIRKITFRDDNFVIDSKSRFSDIVESIPLDSDELIKAITDAIKNEQKKSGIPIKEAEKKQKEEEKKRLQRIAEEEKNRKNEEELDNMITNITDFFRENKLNTDIVKPIMVKVHELGYSNPKEISSIEDANTIYNMINNN